MTAQSELAKATEEGAERLTQEFREAKARAPSELREVVARALEPDHFRWAEEYHAKLTRSGEYGPVAIFRAVLGSHGREIWAAYERADRVLLALPALSGCGVALAEEFHEKALKAARAARSHVDHEDVAYDEGLADAYEEAATRPRALPLLPGLSGGISSVEPSPTQEPIGSAQPQEPQG
jgi:hypothetical protein